MMFTATVLCALLQIKKTSSIHLSIGSFTLHGDETGTIGNKGSLSLSFPSVSTFYNTVHVVPVLFPFSFQCSGNIPYYL